MQTQGEAFEANYVGDKLEAVTSFDEESIVLEGKIWPGLGKRRKDLT